MTEDRQLREALLHAFPPTGSPSVWTQIEERGRQVRRRRRIRFTVAALLFACLLAVGSLQGYRELSDERLLVITDEDMFPAADNADIRRLTDYEGRLVDPASLDDPALDRIVTGLLERGIPVSEAAVLRPSPLTLSITVPQDAYGRPVLAAEEAKRLGAAEAVHEGKLRELRVTVVDPAGAAVHETAITFPEDVHFTLPWSPSLTLELDVVQERLTVALARLDLGRMRINRMELTEHVMDARQLHLWIEVPDFEKNTARYREALLGIGQIVTVSRAQGSKIAVVWVDALDEQSRLLTSSRSDAQLGLRAGQNGLAEEPELAQDLPPLLDDSRWDGFGTVELVGGTDNAADDGGNNLNEELLYFQASYPGSLAGHAIEDDSGNRYEFPDRTIAPGEIFKLHRGAGTDTESDLYWGASSEIWDGNKRSASFFFFDPRGHVNGVTGISVRDE